MVAEQVGLGREPLHLGLGHAEAVHAGIDVEGGRQPAPARAAVGRPLAHLGEAGEHGAQVEAGVVRLGAGQQAVQDVDGGTRLHLAGGAPLVDGGDEEGLAALVGKGAGDGREPQPVGVGLEDAGALRTAGDLVEARPVGTQGAEIDCQDSARRERDRGPDLDLAPGRLRARCPFRQCVLSGR